MAMLLLPLLLPPIGDNCMFLGLSHRQAVAVSAAELGVVAVTAKVVVALAADDVAAAPVDIQCCCCC